MAEFELTGTPNNVVLPSRPLPIDHNKSDVDGWRQEIDSYYELMRQFRDMEPDEIFITLSSLSARAGEIRSLLVRTDTRLHSAFRTREIDPFLDQVDRQFRIWSRVLSVRTMDWEMSKGQT